MYHSFRTEIAEKYGIEKAVLLENFLFWVRKNEANGANIHDRKAYTYNTSEAFEKLFPYMKARRIAQLLREMENEDNLLISGQFGKYDRTKSYTLTDNAMSILGESIIQNLDNETYENLTIKNQESVGCLNTDINHISTTNLNTNIQKKDSMFTDFQQTENLNSENLHTENQTLQNTNNNKILKEQNTNNNIPKQKKHKNGTFQNVLLTDDELQKLIERLGEEKAKAVIDNFSELKEMKGYKYKSDYLAITKWGIIAFEKNHKTETKKDFPDFVKTAFKMISEHNDKQTEAKRKIAISKDLYTFENKEGEILVIIAENRTPQEIISALKNYLYVANMKNTWVNMFTFNAFCKGLDKYLPDYFDYETFADYRIDYDHTTDPDLIFVNKMENEPDFNQYLFDRHVKEWVANGCPEGEEYYRLQETWR